jgi:hypothetical protein
MSPTEWGALAGACVQTLGLIVGLIRYRMRLNFYREIYFARKCQADLAVAGQITRPFASALIQRRQVQDSNSALVHNEDCPQRFGCNCPEPTPGAIPQGQAAFMPKRTVASEVSNTAPPAGLAPGWRAPGPGPDSGASPERGYPVPSAPEA